MNYVSENVKRRSLCMLLENNFITFGLFNVFLFVRSSDRGFQLRVKGANSEHGKCVFITARVEIFQFGGRRASPSLLLSRLKSQTVIAVNTHYATFSTDRI